MKRIFILSFVLAALIGQMTASASDKPQEDWKQRILSEKIAFLTVEMGITPEEAQAFWPVYNEVSKERDEAMINVFKTFKAMEDAIEAGKYTSKLLDSYLDALERQKEADSKAAARYRKVLSEEKVAKLYIGEEKFRRQHIRKLHGSGERPGMKK